MCNFKHREDAMVVIKRNVAWCDPCLAGMVHALFEAGFPTVASCCGHGRRPSRIALADGREVVIFGDMESADAGIEASLMRHALTPTKGGGTGAGGGAPRQDTASAWDNRSEDCPEAPAQATPLADNRHALTPSIEEEA